MSPLYSLDNVKCYLVESLKVSVKRDQSTQAPFCDVTAHFVCIKCVPKEYTVVFHTSLISNKFEYCGTYAQSSYKKR